MKRNKQHIDSFTIFEVAVVVAIIGVLVSIITLSLNRFNMQMKVSQDIQTELNQFLQLRSTIWTDFYQADSVSMTEGELIIYENDQERKYRNDEGVLMLNRSGEWNATEIELEELQLIEHDEYQEVQFVFIWKDDFITLSYPLQNDIGDRINKHFRTLEE